MAKVQGFSETDADMESAHSENNISAQMYCDALIHCVSLQVAPHQQYMTNHNLCGSIALVNNFYFVLSHSIFCVKFNPTDWCFALGPCVQLFCHCIELYDFLLYLASSKKIWTKVLGRTS